MGITGNHPSCETEEKASSESDPYLLTYGHFVLLVIIAIYFQLSVARSFLFDIVFSGIVLFFCYNLYDAFSHGREIVVDIKTLPKVKKHNVYSVQEIKNIRNESLPVRRFLSYRVEVVPAIHLSCSSPTRSSTPDFNGRLKDQTHSVTLSPFSPSSPFSLSPVNEEEQKAYSHVMRELSREAQDVDMIPKDPQIGRIVWMNQNYGRIRTTDPVLKMTYFYFETRDSLMDEEEYPLCEGDRVMFTIQISENRLYAVNVRRVAKRTISSPDFSRLVMRQTNSLLPLDDFEL